MKSWLQDPGVSLGLGRRLRSLAANSAPKWRHQRRMLSWLTTTPRSARTNSMSHRLRANR